MNSAIANPNQALWEKATLPKSPLHAPVWRALIQSIPIAPPVGSGPRLRRRHHAFPGAYGSVVGIDIARNLVEAGNKRAAEAGLTRLKFQEGDASNLEGVAADCSISIRPFPCSAPCLLPGRSMSRARCCGGLKHGGRIVMGNWIPNDPTFVSQLLKISSAFTPPPPEGFVGPMTWGVESHIIDALASGSAGGKDSMIRDTYYFASPDKSPAQFIDLFEAFYGPTMNAVEAARKNGKAEELHKQLVELANSQNKSKDAGTFIPATFMRVTVTL